MFVGHIGAGLCLKRVEPRLNLGVMFLGVTLLDLLLWLFVLLGLESIVVPPDYARRHYFLFVFPYSHGLVASVGWSLAAGIVAWLAVGPTFPSRLQLALVAGGAVLSHFLLDALVHIPELPVLGRDSTRLGLGLWDHMGLALSLEVGLAAASLCFYLRGAQLQRAKAVTCVGFMILLAGMTVAGQTLPTVPPPAPTLALSSIASILIIVGIGFWLDRKGRGAPRRSTGRRTPDQEMERHEKTPCSDQEELPKGRPELPKKAEAGSAPLGLRQLKHLNFFDSRISHMYNIVSLRRNEVTEAARHCERPRKPKP